MVNIDVLRQGLTTVTEQLQGAQAEQIDGKLTELQNLLGSMSPEDQKTLSTEIESVAVVIENSSAIMKKARDKEMLTSDTGIRLALAKMSTGMNLDYPAPDEDEGTVLPWLKSAGDGITSVSGKAWEATKYVGGQIKTNLAYAHKNFIAPGVTAVMEFLGMKNVKLPPVGLHMRQFGLGFIGGFLPKAMRESMQKNLDNEFAFHEINEGAQDYINNQNEVRKKKNPQALEVTFDMQDQFTQFELLTEEERKSIPRKVMDAIKKGETAITLDTLFDVSEPEKKADVEGEGEKKADEKTVEKPEVLSEANISFSALQTGVEIGKYGIVKVKPTPAAIIVNGKTWNMVGVSGKAKGASFDITQSEWNGSTFDLSIRANLPPGFFNFLGTLAGMNNKLHKIPKQGVLTLLDHLSSNAGPYHIKDQSGNHTGVDLVS